MHGNTIYSPVYHISISHMWKKERRQDIEGKRWHRDSVIFEYHIT